MASLDELKKSVAQQAQFLQRFKQMSTTTNRGSKKISAPFSGISLSPSVAIGHNTLMENSSQVRRTLIERQKDHIGIQKSKCSLSPDQLRKLEYEGGNSKQTLGFGSG